MRSALAVALALAAAGCGGSSSGATGAAGHSASTGTSRVAAGGSAAVKSGPVRGQLSAPNHAPAVNKPWPFTVTVTDAAGHPLSGTVDVQFLFAGVIVGRDTPPTHPVKGGRWHEALTYPPPALGEPLTFQTVVHTRLGSITLDWPVKVRR